MESLKHPQTERGAPDAAARQTEAGHRAVRIRLRKPPLDPSCADDLTLLNPDLFRFEGALTLYRFLYQRRTHLFGDAGRRGHLHRRTGSSDSQRERTLSSPVIDQDARFACTVRRLYQRRFGRFLTGGELAPEGADGEAGRPRVPLPTSESRISLLLPSATGAIANSGQDSALSSRRCPQRCA
jgi:hypothetical protein